MKPCRLCRRTDLPLRQSHYLPAALYRIISKPQWNPVVVSATTAISTSEQVVNELLCDECERRFSDGGEAWVISKCWRDERIFPLREDLLAVGAVTSGPELSVFEAANIPTVRPDQLAYFAASVFWRGAAHNWTIQRKKVDRLPFGPFAEAFRLYLMGGPWPSHTALRVYVGQGMEEFRNTTVAFPHRSYKKEFSLYAFTIPGMTFYLFLGNGIPEPIARSCSARSPERYIFMSDETDLANAQHNIVLFKDAAKKGCACQARFDPSTAAASPWPVAEVVKLLTRHNPKNC